MVISGAGMRCVLRATTDVVYVRMHGPESESLYAGSYSDDELRCWADRIADWKAHGRGILVYFNNDAHGYAVQNALALRALLGA